MERTDTVTMLSVPNPDHSMLLHLFTFFSLICFHSSTFCRFQDIDPVFLDLYLSIWFLWSYWKWYFKISLSNHTLLVYSDWHVLTLYFVTLLISLTSPNSIFVDALDFLYRLSHLQIKDSFIFPANFHAFYFFFCPYWTG